MKPNFLTWVSSVIRQSHNLLYRLDRRTLKVEERRVEKLRYIAARLSRKMSQTESEESVLFAPPSTVKGMTELKKEAFSKSVKVPGLKVPKKQISLSQKAWKPLMLKLPHLKPVAELSESDPLKQSHSLLLLDPGKLDMDRSGDNEDKKEVRCPKAQQNLEMLRSLGLDVDNPEYFEVELGYANWSMAAVLRAVLPTDVDNVTSYTQVGHIAHLNLKPEVLPYKSLIGQIILDKNPSVKTVVNKLNTIDNTYRNFSMELLAGEDNYVTQTREHNCTFELDFSKVYWNSRLATEHHRIVESILKGSLVYDVFAGIGPFAVPLAKKKDCTVLANDLNPSSYESLNKNVKLNSMKHGSVKTWNLDGREFILTVVKDHLIERVKQHLDSDSVSAVPNSDTDSNSTEKLIETYPEKIDNTKYLDNSNMKETSKNSYVIMNLPAIAVEFLSAFQSLLHHSFPSSTSLDTQPGLPKESTEPFPSNKNSDISLSSGDSSSSLTQNQSSSSSHNHHSLPLTPEIITALRSVLPRIFCYAFSPKSDIDTALRERVESHLGAPLPPDYSTRVVRNVAPNKEMICVSFDLWPELVLAPHETCETQEENLEGSLRDKQDIDNEEVSEAPTKRQKLSAD